MCEGNLCVDGAGTTGAIGCTNGSVEDDEICDDGNQADGDGCNNDCTESGTLLWEFRSAFIGADEIRDVAAFDDATIFVGGYQDKKAWLSRFSAENGLTQEWSRLYSSAPEHRILSIALSEDSIFAVGSVTPVPMTEIRAAWIARLSLDGELEWESTWSSDDGDTYATQVNLTSDGTVVVAGVTTMVDNTVGVWAGRYSNDGLSEWIEDYPSGVAKSYSEGPGLAVAADAVLVGYGAYKGNAQPELLVAFPPVGGLPLWTRQIDDSFGVVHSLAQDPGGDVIVGAVPTDFPGATLRRLTGTGDTVWATGQCTDSAVRAVALDKTGDILAIGDQESEIPQISKRDVRLCRFSQGGWLRWGKTHLGTYASGSDMGRSVAVLPSGPVVAGGSLIVGPSGKGYERDAWLAVYSP